MSGFVLNACKTRCILWERVCIHHRIHLGGSSINLISLILASFCKLFPRWNIRSIFWIDFPLMNIFQGWCVAKTGALNGITFIDRENASWRSFTQKLTAFFCLLQCLSWLLYSERTFISSKSLCLLSSNSKTSFHSIFLKKKSGNGFQKSGVKIQQFSKFFSANHTMFFMSLCCWCNFVHWDDAPDLQ